MLRVRFFLVEVALRTDVVCQAPGNLFIATDHDCRNTCIAGSGDIKRSTAEMYFVPARDRAKCDVRVAGHDRQLALSVRTR